MSPARSPRRPTCRHWRLGALGLAGALLFAACGGDDDDDTAATAGAEASATTSASPQTAAARDEGYGGVYDYPTAAPAEDSAPAASPGTATVATGETSLGTVLVDGEGFTLYGFRPDADANGEPTCVDDCAAAWPPVFVEGEPDVGKLDVGLFTVVEHPDGPMLKAGDWPLYRFAGDSAPGDANGQGSGDVWFAVSPDGTLID